MPTRQVLLQRDAVADADAPALGRGSADFVYGADVLVPHEHRGIVGFAIELGIRAADAGRFDAHERSIGSDLGAVDLANLGLLDADLDGGAYFAGHGLGSNLKTRRAVPAKMGVGASGYRFPMASRAQAKALP